MKCTGKNLSAERLMTIRDKCDVKNLHLFLNHSFSFTDIFIQLLNLHLNAIKMVFDYILIF
jgi:hypothetical protein